MSADHQVESPDHSLSIEEAAESMGVSAATIRRRIKTGELAAFKRTTPYGFEWRIGAEPESIGLITTADHVVESPDQPVVESADQTSAPEMLELVRLADRLQQEASEKAEKIAELTGTAAHWQARAVIAEEQARRAEEQVKLLMAPKDDPAPEPPAEPERRPWWKRWLG
jgi:excisionase family DNA binding protein